MGDVKAGVDVCVSEKEASNLDETKPTTIWAALQDEGEGQGWGLRPKAKLYFLRGVVTIG